MIKQKCTKTFFEKLVLSSRVFSGSVQAFVLAIVTVLVWMALGPILHFSDTWQLLVNTLTSVVTFLMVFLIQRSQNKDSEVIHLKLNELIASLDGPSNRLIDTENMSEEELKILSKYFIHLGEIATVQEKDFSKTHSFAEMV